jgi:hypothetical protein
MTIEISIKGTEYATPCEAMQQADEQGRKAITIAGRFLVVERAEADRIAAAKVSFAYLCDHHGRIVTVPVN